jgi:hypothetical protein
MICYLVLSVSVTVTSYYFKNVAYTSLITTKVPKGVTVTLPTTVYSHQGTSVFTNLIKC